MMNIEKKQDNPNKIKPLKVIIFILALIMILSASYYTYSKLANVNEAINKTYIFIDSIIMFLFSFTLFFTIILNKNFLKILSMLVFSTYFLFNIFVDLNILKLSTQETLGSKINENINEVIIWGKENNIEVSYEYEYSDHFETDLIMLQDVDQNELLKNVKKINFIVSNGPNLDKSIAISNFAGSSIEDFLNFMNDNYLSNVQINYQINDEIEKDMIVSQSATGNIKRNDMITLTVSLGKEENLIPIELESMKNRTLFDATLYLKRNGIKYNVEYDYSSSIEKGKVISHSPNEKVTVDPKSDTVLLIISKGKEIKVPNLLNMTTDDIVKWVLDNNLKIQFKEAYSKEIIGKVIEANYKEKDIISEGTTIIITTSKGALKLGSYTSLQEFKDWANTYGVAYTTEYEYNDTIARGKIIKISHPSGTIIEEGTEITVYVSDGKAITVPYLVGKSKSSITNTCNNLGIRCTFYYTTYSSTAKDIATTQNVKSGTTVIAGAVINIGLSKGPAQTYNTYIQSNWFGTTADMTIATLKSKLGSACPGVSFIYVKKSFDVGTAGMIHPQSPVKGGNFSCKQGVTYTIWIIN